MTEQNLNIAINRAQLFGFDGLAGALLQARTQDFKFSAIKGDDWRRSIAESRARGNPVTRQIMEKVGPRE